MHSFESVLPAIHKKTGSLGTLARLVSQIEQERTPVAVGGYVNQVSRSTIGVRGISNRVQLGDMVTIRSNNELLAAEVIRLEQDQVLIKPFDDRVMPGLGMPVFPGGPLKIAPGPDWKGRVINALACPLDNKGPLSAGPDPTPVDGLAPSAMNRRRVENGLRTGVNVVDVFVPLCFGQRIGVFAGSGVGKSTLLAMMTKATDFDTVVLALTGERGREVRDMLEDTMAGKLDKTIAVVATGDESPMMRRLAPNTATAIAEYFRERGDNVLLIVDSITRFAHAAREIAIAAREPPVSRGYPPTVFSQLPRLLERAGPGLASGGTITGIYAVLVDGDDHNDPISDAIRGTLDGHIVLDRTIAAQGRFPAVDILSSISRLAQHNWTRDQQKLVTGLRSLIARYEETRDLRMIGAYQTGSDPLIDQAVTLVPQIYDAMQQTPASPLSQDPYEDLAASLRPKEPS
jgi:flagellum-specific ATP synthase